jgi:endonuclease/exonuclease/phosphatase family metal-dependent hydrolase
MAGYEAQIRSLSPDLVTLEEAIPPDVAQLEASGALDRLRYRFSIDRFDPWAVLVASRYRLGPVRVVSMFGRPLVVQTSLELPGGALALWVVHTTAPLAGAEVQWSAQLARVAALLAARRTERLLVTGDFNATWGNRGFARILGTGLADGAAARGDPFEMTWSQLLGPLPPLVRIDHVLTAPGVSVLAIRTATGVGSDHRVLVATIAVRERPRAGRA